MKKIANKYEIVPVKAGSLRKSGYGRLLVEVSGIITQGRAAVLRQIDTTQVTAYWLVGKRIVEFYQCGKSRAEYGEQILIKLSLDLNARFGKGFSVDNLENMRRFYIGFPCLFKKSETVSRKSKISFGGSKSETLSRILSWSHYCELLKEDNERAKSFNVLFLWISNGVN